MRLRRWILDQYSACVELVSIADTGIAAPRNTSSVTLYEASYVSLPVAPRHTVKGYPLLESTNLLS